MRLRVLLFFFIVCISIDASAQPSKPYLEREITIAFNSERLDAALQKISQQGGFSFSYNAKILDGNKTVTHDFTRKTVREVLDELFQGSIEYKIKGKHIILAKAKETSRQDGIITGYVIDEATGERLKNVSVYDPVTLSSAVTDSYGYFEIKLNKPSTDIKLSVNKQDYADTVIAVAGNNRRLLNISVKAHKAKFNAVADSVSQKLKRFWKTKVLHPPLPNLVNIDDSLHRTFQFSMIPFVGTNHMLSGNVVNDYSLNLLGGYNRGVRKAEFGGLFNINRSNVTGAQFAGLFNAVGGSMEGLQIAGLFNANYEKMEGGQFAGLANINWSSASMVSIAGLVNLTNEYSKGVFFAGLSNITIGEQEGVHFAGLFNLSTRDAGPTQFAGLFNVTAKNFRGSQIAGIYNFVGKHTSGSQIGGMLNFTGGNLEGSQVAGILNFAGRRVRGSQVASILNFGGKVNGSQVGLVNIADSVRGVSLGLFSFVLRGYHKLEFSADEVFYSNVAFRTGVRNFYNIFTAGAKPDTFKNDSTYWTFGYGFGTAPRLTKKLFLNLDLTANQVVEQRKLDAINMLGKLYVGFDYQIAKAFSITFGATLNGHLTETDKEYRTLFTDYQPRIVYNETYPNEEVNLKMWWGAKVGLRFF
jgi:hypothetical protein